MASVPGMTLPFDWHYANWRHISLSDLLGGQTLLALTIGAIGLSLLGGLIYGLSPLLGRLMRALGTTGLVAALLLTVAQVARNNSGSDLPLPALGLPEQRVEGGATHVPLGPDGHFWVTAKIAGKEHRFLVDTGATVTAISSELAREGGIKPNHLRPPVLVRTANGTAMARIASIEELRIGNVVARDLDAVITPSMGDMNVLGMNFLTRLKSWGVRDKVLTLVPNHPQAASDPA